MRVRGLSQRLREPPDSGQEASCRGPATRPSSLRVRHDHEQGCDQGRALGWAHETAHGHGQGHGHAHATQDANARRLSITLVLVATYMVAEIVGGLLSNSLALLADAGHMLSDAGALALSLLAMSISRRPPSRTHTFGYQRAEILAALLNGAMLVAISGYIFFEAYRRLGTPPEVRGGQIGRAHV